MSAVYKSVVKNAFFWSIYCKNALLCVIRMHKGVVFEADIC